MKQVTSSEAAQIAARYLGQKCTVKYDMHHYLDGEVKIDGIIIQHLEERFIESIKIPTRTINELTKKEWTEVKKLAKETTNMFIQNMLIVHYTESIGVRAQEEELEFEIKD